MTEKSSVNNPAFSNNSESSSGTLPILAQHLQEWTEGSAVSEEIAELNIESISAEEANQRVKPAAPIKNGGWWTRGVNFQHGSPMGNRYGQFKPDKPHQTKKGEKPAKYLTASGMQPDAIFLRMPDEDYWLSVINSDADFYWTEGVKKAGAGLSMGLPTIALAGVWNFGKDGKLSPEIKKFLEYTKDRTHYICFDSDYRTKLQCVKAIKSLANALKKAGVKNVKIVTWSDDYKGMDDFIKDNGGDAFIEQIQKAVTVARWEKQFVDSYDDGDDDGDSDKDESPKRGKLSLAKLAEELADKYRDKWSYHNEQQTWRIWNGKYWEGKDNNAFNHILKKELRTTLNKPVDASFVKKTADTLQISELFIEKWETLDRKHYVPFSNGVLDLQENELIPHDPSHRFTHCIERDYTPLESSGDILADLKLHCPHTHDYMMSAMSNDNKRVLKLLAVMAGVVKWRFSKLQKFVYIQGKPRAGKGTFVRLIEEMIGGRNFSSTSLGKIGDEKELAKIIDSQVVSCPDEDKQGGKYGVLKSLTGGDSISYRKLYKDSMTGRFYGSIIITSNGSIFAGDSTGIKDRTCFLVFDNQVPESVRSSTFEERLLTEIDNLLSVVLSMPDAQVDACIKGLKDYEVTAYKQREWSLQCEVNSVAAFVDERLKPAASNFISSADMYERYQEFMHKSGGKEVGKFQFTSRLLSLIADFLPWEGVDKGKRKQARGICGLAFRSADDGLVSDELEVATEKTDQVASPGEPIQQETSRLTEVEAPSVTVVEPLENQKVEEIETAEMPEIVLDDFLEDPEEDSTDFGEDEPVQMDLLNPAPEGQPVDKEKVYEELMECRDVYDIPCLYHRYKCTDLNKAKKEIKAKRDQFKAEGNDSEFSRHANQFALIKRLLHEYKGIKSKNEFLGEILRASDVSSKTVIVDSPVYKGEAELKYRVTSSRNLTRSDANGRRSAAIGAYRIRPVGQHSDHHTVYISEIEFIKPVTSS